MNPLCWLFGHRSTEGVHSGAEYMRVRPTSIDGISREHADLIARCPRCDERYTAGRIHRPDAWFDGKNAPDGYELSAGGGWVRKVESR